MNSSIFILGRQPSLGLAELESLYGAEKVYPIGNQAALAEIEPTEVNFARLGGTVKFCKLLTILDTTEWKDIHTFLTDTVPTHASNLPDGKLCLGLSAYGVKTNPKQILATGLELKKIIKKSGRPVRLVPNKESALSSAQVLHNKLTAKLGWELIFIKHGNKTYVAQDIAVQDIDAYAARDQQRPARDARVGMLPPKLAQTIINLAEGHKQTRAETKQTLLDPFCGTGVLLQEAMLMGYQVEGTDLDPRMVEFSQTNLNWLSKEFGPKGTVVNVSQADATSHTWQSDVSTIAAETYLGRALTSLPDQKTLKKIIQDCDTIHTKFLRNVARQTEPGFRMCIAVPAWKTSRGFWHLPTLDSLEKLGYNRVKFVHASKQDMIYYRTGQTVARELVVLERI